MPLPGQINESQATTADTSDPAVAQLEEKKETKVQFTAPTVPKPVHKIDTVSIYSEPGIKPNTITAMEGDVWTAKAYYSQILGKDNYPTRLDSGLDPSVQEYLKIENLDLYVITPMDHSKDDQQIFEVRGGANVNPGIPVNQWDMFVAETNDGRIGLFTVYENPEALAMYKNTGHTLQFELVGTYNQAYENELKRKTVETRIYNSDDPSCPGSLLQDVVSRETLTKAMRFLVELLYREYYDLQTRTLLFKGEQGGTVYDGPAVDFFKTMVPGDLLVMKPHISAYDTPTGDYKALFKTVLDVMLNRDEYYLELVSKDVGDVSVARFHADHVYGGIALTTVSTVRHPGDDSLLYKDLIDENKVPYIFTDSFYDEAEEDMSDIEKMVYNRINGKAFDADRVLQLVKEVKNYDQKQRFYRVIVLIWLLVSIT